MSLAIQAKNVMNALKKLEKESKANSLNELRVVVALERAIARLEAHPRLSSHIVFKGGFVLLKTVDTVRFTRDVDALALGISRERAAEMVERALKIDLDDGLWFGNLEVEDLADQEVHTVAFASTAHFRLAIPRRKRTRSRNSRGFTLMSALASRWRPFRQNN